jgi:hypothetical protein
MTFDVTLCTYRGGRIFSEYQCAGAMLVRHVALEEVDGQELAVPKSVTLSYNEAARQMDGGERVDTLPLSAEILEWLTAFTQAHYHPEPKRKHKKPSFEGGEGVDKMARAEGESHGG